MASMVMEDEILPENIKLKLTYRGKNPFNIYKKIKEIITSSLQITSANYWERDFRWDISTDPRKFYVRIYAKKGLDSKSHLLIETIIQGQQPSDINKEGEAFISFRGKLVTEYKFTSPIQNTKMYKSLVMLYNLLFYWKIRRQYLSMGKAFLLQIYDASKKALNLS